jgi:hypothetical protein
LVFKCTLGYNEFDFFLKMKNAGPLLNAKLKSKTQLQNTFFYFLSHFFAHLASKFSKSANMKKKFSWKKQKRYQKMLILNILKKLLRNASNKVISKTRLTNIRKSEKSGYFCHVFANNFFWCIFQNFINGFEISVKFCIFGYPYWFFE